jgi:prepilin-type N-terminal cleavage/methylation domain-containing protein
MNGAISLPHRVSGASPRAFTLVEVLITLALILALGGTMFAFHFDLIETRREINERTTSHRAAAALIEHLERDLTFCIVGDGRHGAGIAGDEHSLRILTRGTAAFLASDDPDAAMSDLQLAEYRFNSPARRIEMWRGVPGSEGRTASPLGGSIFRVRFRFHDGLTWRNSFDSLAAERLPLAVEVAVWFEPSFEDDWEEPINDEDDQPRRLTFDEEPVFDESAWAQRADRDFRDPWGGLPDRVRVIAIVDAGEEEL